MANFDVAFTKLIGVEGGYNNDSNDPGGETKYGISKRSYPTVDIKNLTLDQAKAIYKRDFWNVANLDMINSQKIAEEMFDSMVNVGSDVKSWLQQAFNVTNWNEGDHDIKVDGIIGPNTVNAINSSPHPDRILKTLNGLQFMHYYNIVINKPSQEKWFGGWLNRVWEN